jgi:hypothetical protein
MVNRVWPKTSVELITLSREMCAAIPREVAQAQQIVARSREAIMRSMALVARLSRPDSQH